MSAPPATVIAAWQAALDCEEQADAGYDILGPRLTDPEQIALARACQQEHRATIVTQSGALAATGATPDPPQVGYGSPWTVDGPAPARQLAQRLEESAAAAWRYLVAVAAADGATTLVAQAAAALGDCAERAVRWRVLVTPDSPTVPFPGI